MQLNNTAKYAMLQSLADTINTNASILLKVYIGEIVAVAFELASPVQSDITDGLMFFKSIAPSIATADGTPTLCEIQGDLGEVIATLPASTIELDKSQLYIGGSVSVLSLTIGI